MSTDLQNGDHNETADEELVEQPAEGEVFYATLSYNGMGQATLTFGGVASIPGSEGDRFPAQYFDDPLAPSSNPTMKIHFQATPEGE